MTCTWNPSDKGSGVTLSNGNLTVSSGESNGTVRATVGKSAGKWYWEISCSTFASGSYPPGVGVAKSGATLTHYVGIDANGWGWYGNETKKYTNAAGVAYGTSWTLTSQVIGFALDMDAGTLELFKNGVSMGTMYSGLSGTLYPCVSGNASLAAVSTANFGATAFTYTPPAGFNGIDSAAQIGTASGFQSTALGTPTAAWTQYGDASGFQSTAFGTPLAGYRQTGGASGFKDTAFGTPASNAMQVGVVSSVGPLTAYGTPSIPDIVSVATSLGVITQYGELHYYAFTQTCITTSVLTTRFGSAKPPIRFKPPVNKRRSLALGIRTTRYGTPTRT